MVSDTYKFYNHIFVNSLFNGKINAMDLHKNLNHLLLAAVIGVVSLGVSFIGDMSRNLQNMAQSIHELNSRMGQVSDTMKDHEFRIREIEKHKL
jgi:methyl-accepting chemotaxis protein